MLEVSVKFTKAPGSGPVATERLKNVLTQDRLRCSDKLIGKIKADIINALSGYGDIDEESFKINIMNGEKQEKTPVIVANMPIRNLKRS